MGELTDEMSEIDISDTIDSPAHQLTPDSYLHERDIPRLPKEITRDEFVDVIFYLGDEHLHGYDTIVAAVQIGDSFIDYTGSWEPFIPYNADPTDELFKATMPQYYSVELAYVATILVAKFNEDRGLRHTNTAVEELENRYVYKMEWELYYLFKHHLRINNFITTIGTCLPNLPGLLPSVFLDICWDICRSKKVLSFPPQTIIAAIIIMGRNKQLDAVTRHKKNRFATIMKKMAHEYEVDYLEILRYYIITKS